MNQKNIYELLDMYGEGGLSASKTKRIQWKDVPPAKVLHILETYESIIRGCDKQETYSDR